MKRKRGAPPGNQNAFRHGFYSALFRRKELTNLEENSGLDLVDEIGLMRIANARLLESLNESKEERDIQTELAILRAICLGAMSINRLVRTRLILEAGARVTAASLPFPAPPTGNTSVAPPGTSG